VAVQTKGAKYELKFITHRVGVQVPCSVGPEEMEEDCIRKVAERGRNHCAEVMPAKPPCPSSARELGQGARPGSAARVQRGSIAGGKGNRIYPLVKCIRGS